MVGTEPNRAVGSGRTRELLLDTAERLFAQRGIHGVSLREIGLAANQRNNGVTQYHFGDKAGLVRAVFERRAVVVNDRRVHLLDEMKRLHRSSMTELVRVFVDPLSEQVELGNWYVPFLSRLNAEHERDELLQPVSEDLNTGFARVRRELRRDHLDALPGDLFANRLRLVVNLTIDALADHQARLAKGEPRALPLRRFVDDLIDVLAGLLSAPTSRGVRP